MRMVDYNSSGNPKAVQTSPAAASRPIGEAAARTSSANKAGQPADRVEISNFSGNMAESLRAEQAARAAKVVRLAAAVESGNYRADPHALAKSIVDRAITGEKDSSGGRR